MPKLKELREKRGKMIADMQAVLDTAKAEERDLSADENERHDKLFDEQAELQKAIVREERQQELNREAAAKVQPEPDRAGSSKEERTKLEMRAFGEYLTTGNIAELRALQADVDITGGYLVPPEQFVANLIKAVDDAVFIRQLATVIPVMSADSLGVPTLDTDPADATWTSEIGSVSEDSAGMANLTTD